MEKQPRALILANQLESADKKYLKSEDCFYFRPEYGSATLDEAAEELRRLHALNAELVEALRKSLDEFNGLPHSLGYDFTHAPKLRALIAKAEEQQ